LDSDSGLPPRPAGAAFEHRCVARRFFSHGSPKFPNLLSNRLLRAKEYPCPGDLPEAMCHRGIERGAIHTTESTGQLDSGYGFPASGPFSSTYIVGVTGLRLQLRRVELEESNTVLPADTAAALDLGLLLGRSQAFGLIAGRCSAAQAQNLSRLRKEQNYKQLTPHWRDFCSRYLKISQTQADQIISLWEEFGPGYFEVAHLTRVSAETYRALAPTIDDGKLILDGEAIELNEENALRVSAAVAALRRALPKKAKNPKPPRERLAALDKRCSAIIDEFQELAGTETAGTDRLLFHATLTRFSSALRRMELECGPA